MRQAIAAIRHWTTEAFGHPLTLLRLIGDFPEMCLQITKGPSVIAAASVIQWHDWGQQPLFNWPRRKRGAMVGWKYHGGRYASFEAYRPEFENIGHESVTEYECEIQDIVGLLSSKSDLHAFTSLDAMVETTSPEMIDEITEQKLQANLAHDQIRILHRKNPSDYFARYSWDGRLFLMNEGGSHHLAAARYIAARLHSRVPLRGLLHTYEINASAVSSLCREFDIFAVSDEAIFTNGFHDAMAAIRATFLWQYLPRPYSARAVLLPKSEPRSMRVSDVLQRAAFFNIGKYLSELANRKCDPL